MTTNYYAVVVCRDNNERCIALFTEDVTLEAMVDFCMTQFANGNSISTPADNIFVVNEITGEILWDYLADVRPDDDDDWGGCEPSDLINECGFDPYMGCFTEDC